ncbi:MAG TPA: ABC transporter permease [Anaerolineae bacterium]|jgi:ABC-type multidrug transport system permease subunit
MFIRRTYAMFIKELRHIIRDVRVLFLVTLAPAFLLLMLSYVFSLDYTHSKLAVLDMDKSAVARELIEVISADGDFELRANLADYNDAEAFLLAGNVDLVLVIPHGFGDDVSAGRATELQALVDGLNPLAARSAIAQLTSRVGAFGASRSKQSAALIRISQPADIHGRAWYNPAVKTLYSMVPGLLAVVLFMPAMSFTLALAREKETGSFEGLMATPVRGFEYLSGKMLAYIVAGMVGAVVAVGIAVFWFQVPFRGDLGAMLVMTGLYFFATMSAGILIAHFVASQQTAMTIFLLAFFLPSFFISGLTQPINTTSLSSLLTSMPIPQTHFITIARATMLKGLGFAGLWRESLALVALGSVMFGAGLLLFRKKMT